MQYCRFQTEDGPQYGELGVRQGELWMVRVIAPPPEDWTVVRLMKDFSPRPVSSLTLLAPVMPSKIVCIGRNYRDHAAISQRVDFEGELGVVIGRTCHRLKAEEDVRPYIRGYVIVNDVTARDLQKSDGQWSRAKGFDTFCPVGPVVSDLPDRGAGVVVTTRLNGEVKQHGSTTDLIFDIPTLLGYISAAMTLNPGDLIATGTPAGVGPMKPGDVVEVEIDGLGLLRNPVIAEEE
jgi:2-keto-4-pentenoate hydratase/2-oxohepta-3-ene-1,7-dioic acid hydratase in catechol pathway